MNSDDDVRQKTGSTHGMKQKLSEIDEEWLRKAGLDPEEVLPH